jgi:hypothetical protein
VFFVLPGAKSHRFGQFNNRVFQFVTRRLVFAELGQTDAQDHVRFYGTVVQLDRLDRVFEGQLPFLQVPVTLSSVGEEYGFGVVKLLEIIVLDFMVFWYFSYFFIYCGFF